MPGHGPRRRILEAKWKPGLFEDPFRYLDPERAATDVFTPENREVAYEAACESGTFELMTGPDSRNVKTVTLEVLAESGR